MRYLLLCFLCFPMLMAAQSVSSGSESSREEGISESFDGDDTVTSGFWIAPNPSDEFIDIYASGISGEISIHVFTILGKKLYSFRPQGLRDKLLLHEDVTSWLPGTYLVRLEQNGTVLKTMRFIRR